MNVTIVTEKEKERGRESGKEIDIERGIGIAKRTEIETIEIEEKEEAVQKEGVVYGS